MLVSYNRARIYTHQERYDRGGRRAASRRARSSPTTRCSRRSWRSPTSTRATSTRPRPLIEDVLRQHPHLDGVQPLLAWCLSARGRARARARAHHRPGAETATADHDIAFWLASFYAMEGLADEARRVGAQGRSSSATRTTRSFAGSRKLDNLRGDPRFEALLEDLQLALGSARASLHARSRRPPSAVGLEASTVTAPQELLERIRCGWRRASSGIGEVVADLAAADVADLLNQLTLQEARRGHDHAAGAARGGGPRPADPAPPRRDPRAARPGPRGADPGGLSADQRTDIVRGMGERRAPPRCCPSSRPRRGPRSSGCSSTRPTPRAGS